MLWVFDVESQARAEQYCQQFLAMMRLSVSCIRCLKLFIFFPFFLFRVTYLAMVAQRRCAIFKEVKSIDDPWGEGKGVGGGGNELVSKLCCE